LVCSELLWGYATEMQRKTSKMAVRMVFSFKSALNVVCPVEIIRIDKTSQIEIIIKQFIPKIASGQKSNASQRIIKIGF
jgi:hypothetical protein